MSWTTTGTHDYRDRGNGRPVRARGIRFHRATPLADRNAGDSVVRCGRGEFCFPIDETCRLETDSLTFNQLYSVTVHDETGRTEASFDASETVRLEERTQFVGLSGPIKLYCRIDAPGTIDIGLTSVRISTDRETTVELGARSLHDRPRGRSPHRPTSNR